MSINIIEIKATCVDPQRIHQLLKEKKATFKGLDHQIDTYFKVTNGRLKLREGQIENTLIHYHRPNQAGPKQSEVRLYKPAVDAGLREVLTAANGILTIVDKQRAIYFIGNVKFHIDEVQGLGSFVEIEAIDETGDIGLQKLQKQCDYYVALLNIQASDLIDCSYSDLLLKKK